MLLGSRETDGAEIRTLSHQHPFELHSVRRQIELQSVRQQSRSSLSCNDALNEAVARPVTIALAGLHAITPETEKQASAVSERPEILILNGPNLNMLGTRELDVYGAETLDDVDAMCADHATTLGLDTDFRQSNFEGEMVTIIQQARGSASGIIINAGAYTHTSVAIHDALRITDMPVIEVHISNIHRRETFRHTSYISSVAAGVIVGLGPKAMFWPLMVWRGYLIVADRNRP